MRHHHHDLDFHTRAPRTPRWHHCPSPSHLHHRVREAAVDTETISQETVAKAAPHGSARRALGPAGQAVRASSRSDREAHDRGRNPQFPQEQTSGTGLRPAPHEVEFVIEEQTNVKWQQEEARATERSPNGSTSEVRMKTDRDMIPQPHHQADRNCRSQTQMPMMIRMKDHRT